jgi:predicted RecA/RadA family phage recombinase
MKNFVQNGEVLTVVAPYAVTSGQGLLIAALFGVAAFDAGNGAQVEIATEGVFDLAAVTADTGAQGAKVYWDNTAKKITVTASANTLVGCLAEAKAGGATIARVYLDGAIH